LLNLFPGLAISDPSYTPMYKFDISTPWAVTDSDVFYNDTRYIMIFKMRFQKIHTFLLP